MNVFIRSLALADAALLFPTAAPAFTRRSAHVESGVTSAGLTFYQDFRAKFGPIGCCVATEEIQCVCSIMFFIVKILQ